MLMDCLIQYEEIQENNDLERYFRQNAKETKKLKDEFRKW